MRNIGDTSYAEVVADTANSDCQHVKLNIIARHDLGAIIVVQRFQLQ
jgi:hypothetical protein